MPQKLKKSAVLSFDCEAPTAVIFGRCNCDSEREKRFRNTYLQKSFMKLLQLLHDYYYPTKIIVNSTTINNIRLFNIFLLHTINLVFNHVCSAAF